MFHAAHPPISSRFPCHCPPTCTHRRLALHRPGSTKAANLAQSGSRSLAHSPPGSIPSPDERKRRPGPEESMPPDLSATCAGRLDPRVEDRTHLSLLFLPPPTVHRAILL
ncbi:hypothetical protein K466DRAFT_145087 [Polyporus arcularius HHB13444]|uniref:Uncharacterized protein n=1 Tax=Polyporus arcularius HHB13444 TaxID=1314778 RepID=A0A5C3PZB3_9APHY|nr:hypothetical protein K466DRAFT_145087 [Polyporus arcularius HHB13444]